MAPDANATRHAKGYETIHRRDELTLDLGTRKLNDLTIIGNVTKTPVTKTTSNGSTVATVAVAIKDGIGPNATSTYLDLNAWDGKTKLVEHLEPGQTCIFTCTTRVQRYVDGKGFNRKALQPTIQEINYLAPGTRMASRQDGRYLGRLTAHPVREGRRVRFSIRIDDAQGRNQTPEYMDCVVFEPLATTVEKYTTEGTQVVVFGRFEIEKYTTRDGKTGDSIRLLIDRNGLTIGWPKRETSVRRSSEDFEELEPLTPTSTATAPATVAAVVASVATEPEIDIDAPFDASLPEDIALSTTTTPKEDEWFDNPF